MTPRTYKIDPVKYFQIQPVGENLDTFVLLVKRFRGSRIVVGSFNSLQDCMERMKQELAIKWNTEADYRYL